MNAIDVLVIILTGILLFAPAMVPNSAAAVFGKKGRAKIDFGRSWRGRRIFGDGKSWRGFAGGIASGVLAGLILAGIAYALGDPQWGYGQLPPGIWVMLCLALGSLLGDLCGAFIKRRKGLERGAKAPVLDQYDFVVGAFLLTALFFPDWVYSNYIGGWHICALIAIILAMFFIHRAVNKVGYRMGVKKEPW